MHIFYPHLPLINKLKYSIFLFSLLMNVQDNFKCVLFYKCSGHHAIEKNW